MLPMDSEQPELPGVAASGLGAWRDALRRSAHRLTHKILAGHVGLVTESLTNQLREWGPRKHPNGDVPYFALALDRTFAVEALSPLGYVVGLKPRFAPSESLRALHARASKGYVSAAEVAEIMGMTDLGGEP